MRRYATFSMAVYRCGSFCQECSSSQVTYSHADILWILTTEKNGHSQKSLIRRCLSRDLMNLGV
ncbi:hypothetical protein BDP27DRAFT_1311992 [Rhodocollybia butyracea]|uniref:Uncharacterized protein n=1 Tax=Rhodocollybia butyracea TaxID=206335 RepID=A0A9P5UEF6_9AGAR|nr:hypothetical protein BDP27DRAFT_1311992 [Rhodocollybia butyracea]